MVPCSPDEGARIPRGERALLLAPQLVVESFSTFTRAFPPLLDDLFELLGFVLGENACHLRLRPLARDPFEDIGERFPLSFVGFEALVSLLIE